MWLQRRELISKKLEGDFGFLWSDMPYLLKNQWVTAIMKGQSSYDVRS
jgi:hypothetical protein